MIPIRLLDTEEGRRDYYTYDPSNPVTLRPHVEPHLDPHFNADLLKLFGKDIHGDQRLRIIWAGTLRAPSFREMEDGSIREYEGMRYPYMRLQKVIGFQYLSHDNKRITVATRDKVPQHKPFTELLDWDDLGVMKFVLEMKYTAEEMVKIGRYPVPGSPEEDTWCVKSGKRYRHKPNPNGEYMFCHYIETSDGKFADVSENTIESIRAIFHRAVTETDEEYVKRKLDERRRLALAEQMQKNLNFADHVENSRIKAEKKLAKGKIAYST